MLQSRRKKAGLEELDWPSLPSRRKKAGLEELDWPSLPSRRKKAGLEELDWPLWPLVQSRRKKARLSMLYKFRHGLLKIDSKCVSMTRNQKKSRSQTMLL